MSPERIDVHFHTVPRVFREAAEAAGRRPAISSGLPAWSPELAVQVMDRHGIGTAVLSISQPGVHFGDDAAARALARRCNEDAAACIARFPGRFGAFAILPLPDVPGACEELGYALDVLRLDGVVLFASYGERFLGDPAFDPLLEALDARGCAVFIHPALHPSIAALKLDLPAFAIEYPFDTTRAATNLIVRGALDRFPRIRFILAHAGGTLPYLAFRLAMSPAIDPKRLGHLTSDDVRANLRRFWYDTALSASPSSLAALLQVADPSRILFGSDWPYAPEPVTAASVAELQSSPLLDGRLRTAIARENALALFPRLAAKAVA